VSEGDPAPPADGDVGSAAEDEPAEDGCLPSRSRLRRILSGVVVLALILAAVTSLRAYVVAPYYIPSPSMEPTLHGCAGCDNDRVLVDKLSYRLHAVHRGDVVVFSRPATWQVPDDVLIKRVVGLPGDRLSLRDGSLYVNGLQLVEPYVNTQCAPLQSLRAGATVSRLGPVPPHQLFVMGDNRCDSSDSRVFGPVPERDLVGRAFVIIWPLGRLHYL
jgi:signal peptidase I